MASPLTRKSIDEAYSRISNFIHRTPVLTSSSIDKIVGGERKLFFKCENFQKTGSFKSRGALNAILKAKEHSDVKGVITQSSGNHGQALAWAAKKVGVPCIVVVPNNAPIPKVEAIAAYGARIERCEATMTARLETCEKLAKETGYLNIDPHNDYDIMEGQGTIAKEFLEQVSDLDILLIAVGGGGMIGGISKYVSEINPKIKVFCVEPEGKELEKSFAAGKRLWESGALLNTVADGLRVLRVGDKCFPVLEECCQHRVFTVNDEYISKAMFMIMQRLKVVVEPSAAVCLAAVLKYADELKNYQKIGIVLCGGNVDLNKLPF